MFPTLAFVFSAMLAQVSCGPPTNSLSKEIKFAVSAKAYMPSCLNTDCPGIVSASNCAAVTTGSAPALTSTIMAFQSCLQMKSVCGKNLNPLNVQVVNQQVSVPGFYGTCYIEGTSASIQGYTDFSNAISMTSMAGKMPMVYSDNVVMKITYPQLNLSCVASAGGSSSSFFANYSGVSSTVSFNVQISVNSSAKTAVVNVVGLPAVEDSVAYASNVPGIWIQQAQSALDYVYSAAKVNKQSFASTIRSLLQATVDTAMQFCPKS